MVTFNNIVVAGGGIIGNSIAYYLAKRDVPVTIVDPVGLSPAASGKAGGFLARDWSDGTALQELQRRSFDLHGELGEEFGSETDYRRLTCAAVAVGGGNVPLAKPAGKKLDAVEWADVGVIGSRPMGDESTIAQVHPRKLCRVLFEYAERSVGSQMKIGRIVQAVLAKEEGEGASVRVKGVKLDTGEVVDADALIVACGPWTVHANEWFTNADVAPSFSRVLPPFYGTKYHSILIKSPRVLSQAVFFQGAGDPEVYPRPDGDAYITGFPDPPVTVEESPGEEEIDEGRVKRLEDATRAVSSELGGTTPHTVQCCYLPMTGDGVPKIGPIPGVSGAFVASGHSCWGILNGPATGEAMAELLVDGRTTQVDLGPFSVTGVTR